MLHEIPHEGFGPLEIVEHDHGRFVTGHGVEQLADRPEHVVPCGRYVRRRQRCQNACGSTTFRLVAHQTFDARRGGVAHEVAQQFGDRREGGRLTGMEPQGVDGRSDRPSEVGGQPGLADAGLTDDRDETGGGRPHDLREHVGEVGHLVLASHQRLLGDGRHGGLGHGDEGSDRFRLAAQDDVGRRGVADPTSRQPPGRFSDQHASGFAGCLESCGDVERVADELGVVRADDHLAGVDPDAETDPHTVITLDLVRELTKSHLQVDSGDDGSQCVVLRRVRDTEQRHHTIAGVLGDVTVVLDDTVPQHVEVSVHHPSCRLGVHGVGERRGVHQVGEERRDVPTDDS